MQQGLFESLTGHFLDGTEVDSLPQAGRMVRSIQDHLQRMFNTRQGSITHLPDYGLPDINDVYRKMPHGVELLQEAIKMTIEKYEPRLGRVRVIRRDTETDSFKIMFMIAGEIAGVGLTRFETTFTSQGNTSIVPWKKAD